MKYKLIAVDLDGTLYNDQLKITSDTLNTMIKAQEMGIRIALASGRPLPGLFHARDLLKLNEHHGMLVAYNGGKVVDTTTNEVLYDKYIPDDLAMELLEHLKDYPVNPIIDDGKVLYVTDKNGYRVKEEALNDSMEYVEVPSLTEHLDFHLNKMSVSGALFDMVKLFDVAKIVISRYSAEKVYNDSYAWAKKYEEELVKLLENKDYALKVLGIERGNAKPRKDIAKWSDLKENISYMYNEEFDKITEFDFGKVTDKDLANKISKLYAEKYFDINDDKQTWFDKMKDLAEEVGFAREVKEWKAEPEKWPGHVGDISSVIRSKLTGRLNTPDLYEIIKVLGKDEVLRRLTK